VDIYTIGFTQKSAEQFFGILKAAGIRRLVDIRLKGQSQLAGFTKQSDLPYFLRELCGIAYHHEPLLTPTKELLADYRAGRITWEQYEPIFNALLVERRVAERLDRALFDVPAVLLCSEATPEQCHRRLSAEYLRDNWGDVSIVHL
jgi:uncharacterized protein (DUF488 family)